MWSSVFGNANVSNLTDPARREIHVESLNKCSHSISASTIYKKEWRHKTTVHYKTFEMNLSNLVENKLDCKRNYCEKRKLFEIRRFEVCTKWED